MRNAVCCVVLAASLFAGRSAAAEPIRVEETAESVQVDTDALQARVRKQGYVSGIAAGSFLDRKTGAVDVGFGLHIMDFLMAPGWRDDGYPRDARYHGDLAKHYIEGPQICTQAKKVPVEVVRGKDFVALRLRHRFTDAAKGLEAGSLWEQTIVFQNGLRYVLCAEQITSVNDVDDLFYRIDMPGHVKHNRGDSFEQIYLSYADRPIPSSAFSSDFAPDAKFLYQRKEGHIPEYMIRAYQVRRDGKPGPWLAGITLDPAEVSEGWCHQRGYVCFIQELHQRKVKKGEKFGAAYAVGWFDDVAAMKKCADRYRGAKKIILSDDGFRLE
jgi:hypothetical protein